MVNTMYASMSKFSTETLHKMSPIQLWNEIKRLSADMRAVGVPLETRKEINSTLNNGLVTATTDVEKWAVIEEFVDHAEDAIRWIEIMDEYRHNM